MYYIVYVMKGAGIENELLIASIQYIINVVMTVPAILWMDRWGRRPMLLLGSLGMMTWLFISGTIQGVYGEPDTVPNSEVTWILIHKPSQAKAIVACSYLFVATFATTWGPVSWTYATIVFLSRKEIANKAFTVTLQKSTPLKSVRRPCLSLLPPIGHGTVFSPLLFHPCSAP